MTVAEWTRGIGRTLLLAAVAAVAGQAVTLEVHNPVGGVSVRVDPGPRLRVRGLGANRKANQEDLQMTRYEERIVVRCEPSDHEPIDLDVELPLGFSLDITTQDGAIAVKGMVRRANLRTKTGAILLSAPWRATRLRLDAKQKPAEFSKPPGFKFPQGAVPVSDQESIWQLQDSLDERDAVYGYFRVEADAPSQVALSEFTIPDDWPIKLPWQAPAVLDEILQGDSSPAAPAKPAAAEEPEAVAIESGTAVFRSDVRMVNLILSAQDQWGRPLTGLGPGDFEVVEDEERQEVTFAGSDDVPFNLGILLDLSGSTKPDRAAMREVAARFVSLLRPHDKVAVYALAGGMFHVVSTLTADREKLLETVRRLPEVSGASPLYDTIVLAYAQELRKRPGERNGLIVISDGIDNQVSRQEAPSKVKFKKLVKAAAEMHALIYPIFLKSGERFGRGWSRRARRRMEQLADASGGKLFPAASLQDLEPVFPQVAAELRSVYSVAYYPKNQDFDGKWRNVRVTVKRPAVKVRSRAGYFAR